VTDTEAAQAFEPNPPRWLRRVRQRVLKMPGGHTLWRLIISAVGAAIVLLGLLLVPLPGPGWVIVFFGVAVWATEFHWAQRLLHRGRGILRAWTEWTKRQPWPVTLLIGVAGLALLSGLAWLGLRYGR